MPVKLIKDEIRMYLARLQMKRRVFAL